MRSADTILAELEHVPAANVEIDDGATTAAVRVGARVVAHIDLRGGGVLVELPPDRIPILARVFPSCHATADGIAFDLASKQSRSEALEAIRRRVNVERLIWQFRAASP